MQQLVDDALAELLDRLLLLVCHPLPELIQGFIQLCTPHRLRLAPQRFNGRHGLQRIPPCLEGHLLLLQQHLGLCGSLCTRLGVGRNYLLQVIHVVDDASARVHRDIWRDVTRDRDVEEPTHSTHCIWRLGHLCHIHSMNQELFRPTRCKDHVRVLHALHHLRHQVHVEFYIRELLCQSLAARKGPVQQRNPVAPLAVQVLHQQLAHLSGANNAHRGVVKGVTGQLELRQLCCR
mmetsp:Transcript_14756/g.42130  ORF Transcript_14756/g.42130 Transcript_14756/m.42130 type:complete len:234 (+) Transcript_14756:261-962(+)